jgi:hypothetical protein
VDIAPAEGNDAADLTEGATALLGPTVERLLGGHEISFATRLLLDHALADQIADDIAAEE